MLIAVAESFWKAPNVFDVAGVLGTIAGIGSIWFSWWLAKRDIAKRIAEAEARASDAARIEVRRVAQAVMQTGISSTIRSLELAREACNGKRWPRAVELCLLAREQLTRALAQPASDDQIQSELRNLTAILQDCVGRLREQPRMGAGELSEQVLQGLDESILALHRVEGRITRIRVEN